MSDGRGRDEDCSRPLQADVRERRTEEGCRIKADRI